MPDENVAFRPEDPYDFMEFVASKYYSFMRTAAKHVLGNWSDADDAVNDAFESLWKRVDILMSLEDANLKGYVGRAAHNAAVDILRSRNPVELDSIPLESVEYMVADPIEPEEYEFEPEKIEWLRKWDYKPKQIHLITLVYYRGYSMQEAAKILHITYANARQIMSRTLRKIAEFYPQGFEGRVGKKGVKHDETRK